MTLTMTLTTQSREIALELHRVLKEHDPARVRGDARGTVSVRMSALSARVSTALESTRAHKCDRAAELRERLADMRAALDAHKHRFAEGETWQKLHHGLQHKYEALAATLRAHRIQVPSLRPTNYARNAFHVAWGCFALILIELFLSPTGLLYVASGFAVYAWSMELLRRASPGFNKRVMRLYGPVAHPHEWHQINSATWYATALVVLASTGSTLLCLVSVAILTFADPAAALVGRRYGRIRLVHGRSLEGTATFALVALLVASAAGLVRGLPVSHAVAVAAGAAVLSALAELFSQRIDDNLSVPLAALAGAWGVMALLG